MRTLSIAIVFCGATACGVGSGTVSSTSGVTDGTEGTEGTETTQGTETTEGATSDMTGEALKAKYLDTVCRLYTEPACVDAQKTSCTTHVGFADQATCNTFMTQTASTCDGLSDAMKANESDVAACLAEIDSFACAGPTAMCDAAGKRPELVGACEPVAALIEACDTDPGDTGI